MKSAWNVGSSQIVVVVLVVLAAISCLAACGSAPAALNSKADLAGASPIVSLLTANHLQTDDFGYGMFNRGLRPSLTSALDACGVKSRIVQVDPLEVEPSDSVEQHIKEFQPSAVMHIKVIGRSVTKTRMPGGGIVGAIVAPETVEEEWVLELKIVDVVSKKQTWMARSMLKFKGKYITNGMTFATRIASHLRDDGVLKGCPTEAVGWPVVKHPPKCREERKSILTQAQQTTDQAERRRLIATMPICE